MYKKEWFKKKCNGCKQFCIECTQGSCIWQQAIRKIDEKKNTG